MKANLKVQLAAALLDPATYGLCAYLFEGTISIFETKTTARSVWPVRGGQ